MQASDQVTGASDEELMRRYAAGDFAAFELLYARHRGGLYRFFLRQTDAAVAEELFQDVWMRVVQSRTRYRPIARFNTWLYTLARNRLTDHWRRRGGGPEADDDCDVEDMADGEQEPLHLADLRDCIRQLLALVTQLPDLQRQAFLLKHEAGLSLVQIAETMGTKAETVKSRLRYAMDRLRQAIAPECLED